MDILALNLVKRLEVITGVSMEGKKVLLFDTEYNNIRSWDADKVWCLVCKDLGTGETFKINPPDEGEDMFHPAFLQRAKDILKDYDYYVGHNFYGAEKIVCERILGIEIPKEKIIDTLVLSRLFRPSSPYSELFPTFKKKGWDTRVGGHGLEAWGTRLGFNKIKFDDFARFSWDMLIYCDRDCDVNILVLDKLVKEQEEFQFSIESIDIEHDAHYRLIQQQVNGFKLNKANASVMLSETEGLLSDYQAELHKVFPPKKVLKEVYEPKKKKDGTLGAAQIKKLANNMHESNGDGSYNLYEMVTFNPGSPAQIGDRLMDLGWNPQKFTATGKPSTDKKTLEKVIDILSKETPEVEVLRKYGVIQHRNSMSREWLALANEEKDGRVRGSVNHIGPWTHRSSHYKPNNGNVAKVKLGESGEPLKGLDGNFGWDSRDCWTVEHGRVLVGADASGIQLRALAHYMECPDYIKEVCDGDIHVTNQIAAGLPDRPTAKTFIYAWLLGQGDENTGKLVGVTSEEYPELFELATKEGKWNRWRNCKGKVVEKKYNNLVWWVFDKLTHENRDPDKETAAIILKGYFTKKKFLDNLPPLKVFKQEVVKQAAKQGYMRGLDGRIIWVPSEHLAMGAYLQGYESVVMKWVMREYQTNLEKQGVPFWQVAYVHDEFQVETLPEHGDAVGQAIVDALIKVGKQLNSLCPLDGEYQVSPINGSWANTH